MQSFQFFSPPTLDFGRGHIAHLPQHILSRGTSILILRGGESLEKSGHWQSICNLLQHNNITWSAATIKGEPSPATIDAISKVHKKQLPDCVVSIGGGSVIDAGKAVAAMLTMPGSVKDYLEKVGHKAPQPKKIPLLAIPTTAGTGSEATKNAVLSEVGPQGFKASLRHDSYVPDIALIDPQLMLDCPSEITAAAAMDALSQLLESYFSSKATPLTDALVLSGLKHFSRSFPGVCGAEAQNADARADIAYAAYLSGLTLANAGLGTVHGIAGTLGGISPLAHGKICGVLVAPVMKQTLKKLDNGSPALKKMCRAGTLLTDCRYQGDREGAQALIDYLESLQEKTGLKNFKAAGLTTEIIATISTQSDNKNNPVDLSGEEITTILTTCFGP